MDFIIYGSHFSGVHNFHRKPVNHWSVIGAQKKVDIWGLDLVLLKNSSSKNPKTQKPLGINKLKIVFVEKRFK
jgi:hypothetical protein